MCYVSLALRYNRDVTQVYTGGLRPFPGIPSDTPAPIAQRMDSILKDCARLGLEPSPVRGADVEDFWEDAIRASAALRACERNGLTLSLASETDPPPPLTHRLGPVSVAEEGRHCPDALLMPEALTKHGGRLMARAWVDTSDEYIRTGKSAAQAYAPGTEVCPEELFNALLWLHDRGAREAVVKLGIRKAGVSRIPLSPKLDEVRAAVTDDDVLCWNATPDAAPPSGFLVQEWVPMTHEYRFFAVDGVLVTGAGCVEEFTPLDHHRVDGRFDAAMREWRGNGINGGSPSPVMRMPQRVSRYAEFLAPIAEGLPHGQRTVVIDVATRAQSGDPLIVEFNSLPNAGLYATDADVLFENLVHAGDRGYKINLL